MILCAIVLISGGFNSAPVSADYKMHCLYLYKFSQLVKWPEPRAKQQFTIGVVGITPLAPSLEQYLSVKNNSSAVKYKLLWFKSFESIADCDLLYVSADQLKNFDQIVKKMNGRSTLIVSEVKGLIKRGAGINFIYEEGTSIKVQINKTAIEAHKLKVSSELLSLGTVVE